MFCRKCGNEIPDDSAFCPKCGERVVTSDIEETAAASPVVSHEKTAEIVPDTPMPADAAVLPQKKNKLKAIFISIGALVAVLAVVFFAVILPEMHLDFYYERDPETGEYIILGTINDVKEINIPDTIWFIPVRAIDDEALRNSSVESVSFGKNIRYIGMNAFRTCMNLKTVRFSDKMEYDYDTRNVAIGAAAFGNCIKLREVKLPNIGTNIYGEAFLGCVELSDINLENVAAINFRAFGSCMALAEVDTDAELGDAAFEECTSLRNVSLLNTKIPERCFYGCTALESVRCSQNNGAIQENAFKDCSNLSDFYVDGITYNNSTDLNKNDIAVSDTSFDGCDNFNSSGGFNPNNMLIYTPEDFMGENLYDVAKILGAEYTVSGHNEYSAPGFPTFHILGKPFEYTLDEYYYIIMAVSFYNQDMWLSSNGSCTDKIHLGMSHDEILDILLTDKKRGDTVSDSNDKINVYIGETMQMYNIYFDGEGTAVHCEVIQDMP